MNNKKTGGVSLLGIIQVVLLALKITGVIDWSIWLVLLPLWISIGFWIIVIITLFVIAALFDKDSGFNL